MTSLTLVRRIKAPPSIVFDAFSTAEGLTHWWGPDDLPVLSAEADVRIGGRFRVRFRRFGGDEHECTGDFLEIVRPERLVMSWRWDDGGPDEERKRESRVELHLRPIETGTEVTLVHAQLADMVSQESHTGGWGGALEKLVRIYGEA